MVTQECVSRGDIYLVALNPTRGSEIRKTRPYPFRVRCSFDGKDGHVVADQLRAVDRERLVRRLGSLSEATLNELLAVLQAMFAV
jgi:mRNA interferase MazF